MTVMQIYIRTAKSALGTVWGQYFWGVFGYYL